MKQDARDSQKRLAFPIQLYETPERFLELPDEIHVVPTGEWSHPVYGEMEITSKNIAEFVQNFRDRVRKDIPITAGHDNGMNGGELRAIGWFKELIDRGVKGLYAVVEWTEEGKHLLEERAFKYFSPEFYEEYSDPETGEKRNHVLVGGALTNKPYFKELEPVVFAFSEPTIMNQFNEPMDLKTILAKKASELSADEKKFLSEKKSELTPEQVQQFASVFDEDGGKGDEKGDEEKPEEGEKPQEEVQASEKGKQRVMSEAEYETLRAAADKGAEAFAEVEKMKLGQEVEKLVFSASNAEGRILPKQRDALVALMFSLNTKQRDQLRNILSGLPKPDGSIFKEIGDGGATPTNAKGIAEQVKTLASEKVKASNGALKYSQAVAQVFAEKPELKQQYADALKEGAVE